MQQITELRMNDAFRAFLKVGMKLNMTNFLFICNIVVFVIHDLSVHFIIF